MVILLLFLHKNLIDLERFVNLAILQNIPNFKSIYNNLQKYDLFEIYHGLSGDHGELSLHFQVNKSNSLVVVTI